MDDCSRLEWSCENGGQAVDTGKSCECQCAAGYTGEHCETGSRLTSHCFLLAFLLANRQILNETCRKIAKIYECESAPCLNGGVCTDRVNRFEFSCAAAWSAHTRGLNVYTLTCVSHVDVAPGNMESYRIQFYRLTYMSGALCF